MADKPKVTRITAKDDSPKAAAPAKVSKKTAKTPATKKPKTAEPITPQSGRKKNVFARIGGYFKGAWVELKQVRWPTRKATWGLTLAVLIFSAFFLGFILLLDFLFQELFQLIIA